MESRTERRRRSTSRIRTRARKSPARTAKQKSAPPAGSEEAMMAAWQRAMTPGKGHARLEPLVGKFDVSVKLWMQPGAPPSEGSGTSTQKWILGGRYLQQTYRGKSMGMPFQGVGHTGFDNAVNKYVGTWMDTMGTGIMTSIGTGKPTARKIEFDSNMVDPMTGQQVTLRSIIRIKDQNRNSFEMWGKGPDGKEFRTMIIEYKRRK